MTNSNNIGFNPTATALLNTNTIITPQYVGADGEYGVTVHKAVDTNVFKMCHLMTTSKNVNSINFNSSSSDISN